MARSKIAYPFVPVPEKRARAWSTMKHILGRALATELWLHGHGQPIEVDGDWRIDLCRQLGLTGRHRTNWCQAMDEAASLGLLTLADGFVTVHYTNPTPTVQQPNTNPTPTQHQLEPKYAKSIEVDLTEEKRVEESREREIARARAHETLVLLDRVPQAIVQEAEPAISAVSDQATCGFRFVASTLGRSTFDIAPLGSFAQQYAWIGSRPPTELEAVRKAVDADPWCRTNAHCVDARHLQGRWQRYLRGAPKPIAQVDQRSMRERLDALRKRVGEKRAEQNMLDNSPWFDKETKWHPEALAQTRAQLAAAEAELKRALAESQQQQAVAS